MKFNLSINLPLVSIITPLYNSEKYIRDTIESVLNQTYSNWELIVVDDCSTDNSVSIVLDFSKTDSRICLIRLEKNYGNPYHARNIATEKSNGEFIAFLDSDDIWLNTKLEKQILFAVTNNYSIVFTSYIKFYETNSSKRKIISVPKIVNYGDLLRTNHIGSLTVVYSVKMLGKLYQINHKHEDYIMWLQTLQKGYKAYGLNEVLAYYRVHDQSISNNKLKMALVTWNIYIKIMNIGFFKSIWYFCNYILNGLKKK